MPRHLAFGNKDYGYTFRFAQGLMNAFGIMNAEAFCKM